MKETSKIYVDIASLLDIRQAILTKLMNLTEVTEFLNSDKYNFRDIDIFPVDMNLYNEINNNKEVDLLPRSTVTYVANTLKTKILNLEKRNTYYGETKVPEVILNVYPFKLTEEQANSIQNFLFVKLDSKCLITIINKPVEEITPYFIKSLDVVACYIYDFTTWLDKHTDSLNVTKLPDTLFYFPTLYKVKDDTNEIDKIVKMGFKDVFGYLEFMYSSVANINFLPIVFYSNIITSTILIDQVNEELKGTSLGDHDGSVSEQV